MKLATTNKTVCALFTGLLIASASALAQVAPPTPAQAAGPDYFSESDTSIILPKATSPNFYLQGGLIYTKTKIGDNYRDKDSTNMYGINVAFGWRMNKNSKLEVEVGFLGSSEKKFGSSKVTYSAIPILASYNFCIPLTQNQNWELRLAPTIGCYIIGADYDDYYTRRKSGGYGWVDGNDAAAAFAYGAGVAVTRHINQRFYIDFGYRFLGVSSADMDYTKIKSQTTHSITAVFGWKF